MKTKTIYLAEMKPTSIIGFCRFCAFSTDNEVALVRFYSPYEDRLKIEKKNLPDFKQSCEYYFETKLPSFSNNGHFWNSFIQRLNTQEESLRDIEHSIYDIARSIVEADEMLRRKFLIITDIRKLYESGCDSFDGIATNPAEYLASLFKDAISDLSYYNNAVDTFIFGESSRLPNRTKNDCTLRLQDYLKSVQHIVINETHQLSYLGRELSPLRTTHGFAQDGTASKHSGAGGIDIVCVNQNKQLALIEYKSISDKSLQYGLIQLLTYCSELSTYNQKNRLSQQLPLVDPTKVELYIMFDHEERRGKEISILGALLPLLIAELNEYISGISLVSIRHKGSAYEFDLVMEAK